MGLDTGMQKAENTLFESFPSRSGTALVNALHDIESCAVLSGILSLFCSASDYDRHGIETLVLSLLSETPKEQSKIRIIYYFHIDNRKFLPFKKQ